MIGVADPTIDCCDKGMVYYSMLWYTMVYTMIYYDTLLTVATSGWDVTAAQQW